MKKPRITVKCFYCEEVLCDGDFAYENRIGEIFCSEECALAYEGVQGKVLDFNIFEHEGDYRDEI